MPRQKIFLLSVDLEDVRLLIPDGLKYRSRVPEMTGRLLEFLRKHDAKCTFFVVGDMLRNHPELIKRIRDSGHEIACHTDTHLPLSSHTPDSLRKDMENFLSSARQLGIEKIDGFRAPVFSLTEKTAWVYPILREFGIVYSSSVLPAKNPLYGWKEFGSAFRVIDGVKELPITLHSRLQVPLAGGVYLRLLPFFLLRNEINRVLKQGIPLQNYLHPYDIDPDQERFMHPGINNSRLYNALMYYNRKSVFRKLEKILSLGVSIVPYREYVTGSHIADPSRQHA